MDKRKVLILGLGGFILLSLLGCLITSIINFNPNSDDGLKGLSFNGISLGDEVNSNMKKYLIMDNFNYSHEYNNILFSYDSEDKIYSLGFYSSWDSSGDIVLGIDDIIIKYKNNVIRDLSDFEKFFGKGKSSYINNVYTGVSFYEDDVELYLQYKDDILINMELRYIDEN